MPLRKVKSTKFLLSKDPSPSINSAPTTISAYLSVPNTNYFFWLPHAEAVNDANRSGRVAPTHQCPTYVRQDDIVINDEVDFNILPRLLRRLMGGVPIRTEVVPGVIDYVWGFVNPEVSAEMPASGFVANNGPAHFLMDGVKVDKCQISASAAARAQHSTTMVGTGKFTQDPFGASPYPAAAQPACTEGRKKVIKFMDGASEVNLTALGIVEEWSLGLDNFTQRNVRTDGDPGIIVDGVEVGYVRSVPRGSEDQDYLTSLSFVPKFENLDNWKRGWTKKELEDFSILIPGKEIKEVTGTKYFQELEFMIPKFSFEEVSTGSASGRATTPISVLAHEGDDASKSPLLVRLRTDEIAFEGVTA